MSAYFETTSLSYQHMRALGVHVCSVPSRYLSIYEPCKKDVYRSVCLSVRVSDSGSRDSGSTLSREESHFRSNLGKFVNLHLLMSIKPFIPIWGRYNTSFGWGLKVLSALVRLTSNIYICRAAIGTVPYTFVLPAS
jgi:hypothetical protein